MPKCQAPSSVILAGVGCVMRLLFNRTNGWPTNVKGSSAKFDGRRPADFVTCSRWFGGIRIPSRPNLNTLMNAYSEPALYRFAYVAWQLIKTKFRLRGVLVCHVD